jgi:hypothetical protein
VHGSRPLSLYLPSNGVVNPAADDKQAGNRGPPAKSDSELVYGEIVPSTKPIVDQSVDRARHINGPQDVIYADLSSTTDNTNKLSDTNRPEDFVLYANTH